MFSTPQSKGAHLLLTEGQTEQPRSETNTPALPALDLIGVSQTFIRMLPSGTWKVKQSLRRAAVPLWWRPASSGVVRRHLLPDEAAQALQILAVQFNVIVSRSLHPQRLHRLGAALEQSQAVGEVDHLVFCPVDNQHRGRDFRNLLNAKRRKKKKGRVVC